MVSLSCADLAVSERKPVGSTRNDKDSLVDLMGDESASVSNGDTQPVAQTTHDLLADIFGSGGEAAAQPPATSASAQSAVDDIMGLFGNTGAANPTPTQSTSTDLLSSMSGAPNPSPAPEATATAPVVTVAQRVQLQAYTAYEGKGLKVTLTPKTSAQQPGIVQILAKFTATGSDAVTNVNFQAAVPRVSVSN